MSDANISEHKPTETAGQIIQDAKEVLEFFETNKINAGNDDLLD